MALQFKKRAFITEKEILIENEKENERMSLVNFELEKNNRFLNILTNKIPKIFEDEVDNHYLNKEKIEMNVEM